MDLKKSEVTLEKIVSLCKRRGLIFQSADNDKVNKVTIKPNF